MAAYAIPSDKPFVIKSPQRHSPTPEQKALKAFFKTHTVWLVGWEDDGTPVLEVVKKQTSN